MPPIPFIHGKSTGVLVKMVSQEIGIRGTIPDSLDFPTFL